MGKWLCCIVSLIVLVVPLTLAEGFFPSTDELFGTAMPSLTSTLNRSSDGKEEVDGGQRLIYREVTAKDYVAFSAYLGKLGCVVESTDVTNGVLTADIAMGDGRITFTWDDEAGIATVFYPEGTREEDAVHGGQGQGEVLPDYVQTFGTGLPSMAPVVDGEPKVKKESDASLRYEYIDVSEAEYDAFSRYLKACGCTQADFNVESGVAIAELKQGSVPFTFEYDSNTHIATINYPAFSFVEDGAFEDAEGKGLMPLADEAFGIVVPRIELATQLKPEGLVQTTEGYEETYHNFTEEDYAKFSAYLQERGCTVVDYGIDENGILTVNLEKSGVPFSLTYDRIQKSAVMRYAPNSRPEPTPTPEPTPIPTSAPKPQATKRTTTVYSESDCWRTAEAYFKSMSWKNPDSLQIHGHTSTLSEGAYTFLIDYSAQNSFGGYNRKTGMVVVDANTNQVSMAWAE